MARKLVDVSNVKPLQGFRVRLRFEDGTEKVIDLEPFLRGPVFAPIRKSRKKFLQVRIEDGSIAWPNGADICPDTLYRTPAAAK